jgi:hypothetical protein
MNIFYPRSVINLIFMMSYIYQKKISKKKNFLILEKFFFNDFLKKLKKNNFLKSYFSSIKIISTPYTKPRIFSLNFFELFFYVNKQKKKIEEDLGVKKILKIKISNFFGGGTYLDDIFYKKYYSSANFYYVEHGIGHIINNFFGNKIKLQIRYLIKKVLNFIFSNNYTLYYGYVGILNHNLPDNIYINDAKVLKNITVKLSAVKNIINIFIKNFRLNFFFKKKKKNLVVFNWDFFIKPTNKKINGMLKVHNFNNNADILLVKNHNNVTWKKNIDSKLLINIFKRKKIKFLFINENLSFLPLEVFIFYFNVKKIISTMSSVVFFMSILNKNVISYLYFSYYKFYKFNNNKKFLTLAEVSNSALKIYKKYYSNILYH